MENHQENTWPLYEEMLLFELVNEHGKKDWTLIASELAAKSFKKSSERTATNCKIKYDELFSNYYNPFIQQ
ncbi:unnamed protein product [Rhizophagus irregularis]|uniref:Myb-like domain-containing protein n=1 Tax=Rhizophagus irregularis TaxID=588596 RepID=A0A2N1NZK0_9GLOM|nr:hypothetical protein RhiirC2_769309 [Rhizophagus irregularis]CAB4386420.1 unnamed protein product [Rhizophagus irregularis]